MSAAPTLPTPPAGKKYCIACEELIPIEATVCSHCRSSQAPERTSWDKTGLKWIAAITAVIGLITGLSGLVGPLKGWWTVGHQSKAMLATALKQEELGEYSSAFDTLSEILKNKPGNIAATHARLDVTMLWIEDTWAPRHTDDELTQRERAIFAKLTPVLEAGLGTEKDYRAADVVAHLAWLNLLKWKILNEDGRIEDHLQHALDMEPGNVYANAMMGDFILETQGSLDEAKAHFATALKTDKVKEFVRGCQLQAMIYNNSPGVRAELVRVANEMRKNGEPFGENNHTRVLSDYMPASNSDAELREVLAAVPAQESWDTFVWLNPPPDAPSSDPQMREYIRAELDEIIGKKSEALQEFRQLQQELKKAKQNGTLMNRVDGKVKELSK